MFECFAILTIKVVVFAIFFCGNVEAMDFAPWRHERYERTSTGPTGRVDDVHASFHGPHDIYADV